MWLATTGMLVTSLAWVGAQRPSDVPIDADDIGGTVSGPKDRKRAYG